MLPGYNLGPVLPRMSAGEAPDDLQTKSLFTLVFKV